MVDIKDARALEDFKVIEIVDDINPYPMLLGIDWATDMNGVINLKKHKMIFEKTSLCIMVSLDLEKESCYIDPMSDDKRDDDLDYIYNITTWEYDWVNPTMDGMISWERESSYTSDSDEEIEHWQSQLHDLTMLN